MTPGRNEPCPCGSGKKFKHCCLNAGEAVADSPETLTWRRVRRAINGLPGMVLHFVTVTYGPEAVEDAWEEFVLDTNAEDMELDPQTPHMQLFMPWFFHCWSPKSGEVEGPAMSPTRAFLNARGSRLEPIARRYLEACLEAPFSFHEIIRSDPGHGFSTRDVITGEEHRVIEHSASKSMQVGDILYGQLVNIEGITLLEACAPRSIPPTGKITLIDLRQSLPRLESLSGAALLRELDCELREFYFILIEDVLNPRMPQLQNTDGDPLELRRLVFDIDSPQVAFDALAHLTFEATPEELLQDAERDANGALKAVKFDWAKAGNSKNPTWTNTILGHLEINGAKLIAEVNSARRAQELRRIVEEALGNRARYRSTKIQSVEKMMEEIRARQAAGEEPERDPEQEAFRARPEVQAQVRQEMSAHFEAWVDMAIPALGGLTPMEAIRTPEGKEKVAALVVEAERHARTMDPPVDEAVLLRLRERLGLMPAGSV